MTATRTATHPDLASEQAYIENVHRAHQAARERMQKGPDLLVIQGGPGPLQQP